MKSPPPRSWRWGKETGCPSSSCAVMITKKRRMEQLTSCFAPRGKIFFASSEKHHGEFHHCDRRGDRQFGRRAGAASRRSGRENYYWIARCREGQESG